MESFQQYELILTSKMASPSKSSTTEDLAFGDVFPNGNRRNPCHDYTRWLILTCSRRSFLKIRRRIQRHWLYSRTWQRRQNVHRWWVKKSNQNKLDGANSLNLCNYIEWQLCNQAPLASLGKDQLLIFIYLKLFSVWSWSINSTSGQHCLMAIAFKLWYHLEVLIRVWSSLVSHLNLLMAFVINDQLF
jgi:hypothetical protein